MTAEEARQLAGIEKQPQEQVIKSWLNVIHGKIRKDVKARKVIDPFSGVRMLEPTKEEKQILFDTLVNEGYKISLTLEGVIIEW